MYGHKTEFRTHTYPNCAVVATAVILLIVIVGSIAVIRWRQDDARALDLRPYADLDHTAQARVSVKSPQILSATGADSPTLAMQEQRLSDRTHAAERADDKASSLDSRTSSIQSVREHSPSAEQIEQFSTLATELQGTSLQPILRLKFSSDHDWTQWETIRGTWAISNGTLIQERREGFDNAVLYKEPLESYVLRVPLRHVAGTGAGVLFNLPSLTDISGGHLVRFAEDATGIFWGYFDPIAGFTGQGYAPTGNPGTEWHLIEVLSGRETYSIWLNSELVAGEIPLFSRQGVVGLTTTGSVAEFHSIEFLKMENNLASVGEALSAFATIAGQWTIDEYAVHQSDTSAADLSVGTGMSAAQYKLELSVQMPSVANVADAGAGILFHMPFPDRIEGAHMVRFVDGGRGIAWGVFDADGNFTGQGFQPLDLSTNELVQVELTVEGDSFAVAVNGLPVIVDGVAVRERGWIGLTTYRGPVTFRDISFTPNGAALDLAAPSR